MNAHNVPSQSQPVLDLGLDLSPESLPEPLAVDPGPANRQWRLTGIQLANWGTLDGQIYRFPVSRRGHLITGPSGSGKSSILDAIAAVLTPDQWLRFNEAAQGGSARAATRSLISYIRGAWTRQQDEEEDRVISAYLRPRATWSGIVLQYEDGTDRTVSLCRLFFLRGTAMTRAEMKDLCMLEQSAVDLTELQPLIAQGIQTRKVQSRWPDAVVTTNTAHGPFYTRLRSVFGIRDQAALHLLHRTQSAKGLDSLDQLFRNHMLERPVTFQMAERAVQEFGALRIAYERVVDLRRQRDHLMQLRSAASDYDTAEHRTEWMRRLQDAVLPYQHARLLEEIAKELRELDGSLTGLRTAHHEARSRHNQASQRHLDANLMLNRLGGDRITDLQRQLADAQEQLEDRLDRWAVLTARLTSAGLDSTPQDATEYAELQNEIIRALEQPIAIQGATHDQHAALSRLQHELKDIDADIDALRRGGSAVPRSLQDVRGRLAEHLELPTSAIPFAAELLEVDAEHREWTGAIERVLSPLSLTLLVPARVLRSARAWIDSHHLNLRLRYEEITTASNGVRPVRTSDSLVHKVTVRTGEFHDWMQARLSERFDYACVRTADDLDHHDRAVTLTGQVKSSATRYEKNDRHRVDDRSQWVLGDPAAKLEVLVETRTALVGKLEKAQAVVVKAQEAADAERQRRADLKAVQETPWKDVDHGSAQRRLEGLRAQLEQLTSRDTGLQSAQEEVDAALTAQQEAAAEAEQARLALDRAQSRHAQLESDRAELQTTGQGQAPLPQELREELDRRYQSVRRAQTRNTLPEITQTVLQHVNRELEAARSQAEGAAQRCTVLTTEFSQHWQSAAADATPGVEDRAAYLEILDRITGQGLPEHEERFQQLLHDRSSVLIGELHSEIRSAPGEIENRVEPINQSLGRSPFDEGRFLRLRVRIQRSETVRQFMKDLSSVAEHSWADEGLGDAELRYQRLAALMDRFASSEHADRVWRQQCLDTREHVTFLAQEIDAQGTVRATYDSGAAMSGGQQQKLVIFCLAAALRYQLASPDDPVPSYGTVVLDEAFDKADVRYTRMAMDVFVEFGFQMVLATPQKLLQTIEPYVGGITTVNNPTRRHTLIADVTWDAD